MSRCHKRCCKCSCDPCRYSVKGERGDKGRRGEAGEHGHIGDPGRTCHTGPTGFTGPCCTGSTGPISFCASVPIFTQSFFNRSLFSNGGSTFGITLGCSGFSGFTSTDNIVAVMSQSNCSIFTSRFGNILVGFFGSSGCGIGITFGCTAPNSVVVACPGVAVINNLGSGSITKTISFTRQDLTLGCSSYSNPFLTIGQTGPCTLTATLPLGFFIDSRRHPIIINNPAIVAGDNYKITSCSICPYLTVLNCPPFPIQLIIGAADSFEETDILTVCIGPA